MRTLLVSRSSFHTIAHFLRRFACFSGLTLAQMDAITENLSVCDYLPGEWVFRKGESADGFYGVCEGSVRVLSSDATGRPTREIARLNAGDFFGEMALLNDIARSASVQALESTKVLRLSPEAFLRLTELNALFGPEIRRISAERYLHNLDNH